MIHAAALAQVIRLTAIAAAAVLLAAGSPDAALAAVVALVARPVRDCCVLRAEVDRMWTGIRRA